MQQVTNRVPGSMNGVHAAMPARCCSSPAWLLEACTCSSSSTPSSSSYRQAQPALTLNGRHVAGAEVAAQAARAVGGFLQALQALALSQQVDHLLISPHVCHVDGRLVVFVARVNIGAAAAKGAHAGRACREGIQTCASASSSQQQRPPPRPPLAHSHLGVWVESPNWA